MRLIVFAVVLTTNYSFGQDTVFFDAKWKPTNKKSADFFRIDKKENDHWKRSDFYLQGQLQMTGTLKSTDPEIKEGKFEYYHSNGKLKHTGSFKNDREVGEHRWYTDAGTIEAVENYRDGKLNGAFKEYHSNGKLSQETSFKDGLQEGKTIYYSEDGVKLADGNFKDGDRIGIWAYYDESGKIKNTHEFKTDYVIKEANMFIRMPNSEWELTTKSEQPTQYVFKRTSVKDREGREIIPGIIVAVEDASKFNHDVTQYTIAKRMQFRNKQLKVDKILIHENKEYPLSYKNAFITKCSYNENGTDNLLYMIHIINDDNKGIQIYMDMTKDLGDEYEQEIWTTMKSIRENK